MKEDKCHDFSEKLWIPDPHPTADSVRSNFGGNPGSSLRLEQRINMVTCLSKLSKLSKSLIASVLKLLGEKQIRSILSQSLNSCYHLRKIMGKKGPELTGSQREIGTQTIFIRKHLRDKRKILSLTQMVQLVQTLLGQNVPSSTTYNQFTPLISTVKIGSGPRTGLDSSQNERIWVSKFWPVKMRPDHFDTSFYEPVQSSSQAGP